MFPFVFFCFPSKIEQKRFTRSRFEDQYYCTLAQLKPMSKPLSKLTLDQQFRGNPPLPESVKLGILRQTTDLHDKTEKKRGQMIITQFYSKVSPVIQATMDKHKGQIVSLQDLVMFCDNLKKELKIQDELFEQRLQKHHPLAINEGKPPEHISHMTNQDPTLPRQTYSPFRAMTRHLGLKKLEDTMEPFENTISTLITTDRTPGFFQQLMPEEKLLEGATTGDRG
uniref:Uncharacterized protein n=1 Tax=Romanomermis culicivorax TaxID=13658 RepID=A0A915K204_ROMCU